MIVKMNVNLKQFFYYILLLFYNDVFIIFLNFKRYLKLQNVRFESKYILFQSFYEDV